MVHHTVFSHTHYSPPPPSTSLQRWRVHIHTQAAKLNTCKTELEASSGFASSLSMINKYVSTASMLPKGDCGMLLDHCFKAPSDSLNIFFRCLPRYNITKQYVGKHEIHKRGFRVCGEGLRKFEKCSVAPSPSQYTNHATHTHTHTHTHAHVSLVDPHTLSSVTPFFEPLLSECAQNKRRLP